MKLKLHTSQAHCSV